MRRQIASLNSVLAVAYIASLAAATVAIHLDYLSKTEAEGRMYLETAQLRRHLAVIENRAGSPWQYRVLSEYMVLGARRLAAGLGIERVAVAFVSVRFAYVAIALGLAWVYYRWSGFSPEMAILGIGFVTAAMAHAVYDSGLSIDTYGDLVFFLLGAVLLLRGKDVALVLVSFLAVLNRETALLIPVMFLFDRWSARRHNESEGRGLVSPLLALCAGVLALVGVRIVYSGVHSPMTVYGRDPGMAVLLYNIVRPQTYVFLLLTFGVVPLLALNGWSTAGRRLRTLAIALVPAWVGVHLLFGQVAETRYMLVPLAVVLVPLALAAIAHSKPGDIRCGYRS